MQKRRDFIRSLALAGSVAGLAPRAFAQGALSRPEPGAVSFFLAADTHYRGDLEDVSRMDATSADYNRRLVEWLNKLPGTAFPDAIGGGMVPAPQGVLHGGDLVDTGDKGPS